MNKGMKVKLTNVMACIALAGDVKWACGMLGEDLTCEHLQKH